MLSLVRGMTGQTRTGLVVCAALLLLAGLAGVFTPLGRKSIEVNQRRFGPRDDPEAFEQAKRIGRVLGIAMLIVSVVLVVLVFFG